MDTNNYIVYALIDPRTSDIRYIGITQNPQQRERQHRSLSGSGGKAYNRWKRKLAELNETPEFDILEIDLTLEEAREEEARWIEHYKLEGYPILNPGDGGGGFTPEKAREIWADRDEEDRRTILEPFLEAAHSLEARQKAAATLKDMGFWDYDEERCQKCGNAMRGKRHTEEAKAKISASVKAYYQDHPEACRARSERQRGCKMPPRTEEWKQRQAEARLKFDTPEYRQRVSDGVKRAWARGDYGEERNRKIAEDTKRRIAEGTFGNAEQRRRAAETRKKNYPAFYNVETGEVIPAGRGLCAMCRERGLCPSVMGRLVNGKRTKPYNGWVIAD